jgi:acetyl esterase/lipase
MTRRHLLGLILACLIVPLPATGQEKTEPNFTRTEDVIYGRKHGTALTMDVFTPKEGANGAAVVWMVSGGWFSAHAAIGPAFIQELLDRGYTVFAVVHGSQPKFTIPECVTDVNRAVRYIRHHADDYKIDPDRIGVTGGSAGGHLSLMLGTAADKGNADANDPVDQTSSRVQAVACFFPPTDFLNYGKEGETALGTGILKNFKAPFDFTELDPATRSFVLITDEQKRREIGRQISPVYHVTPDDPPTLVIHGDADKLVPIQQAELIMAKFKEAGVEHKLVVKPGGGHGWPNLLDDMKTIADWFDDHLNAQ